MEPQLPKQNPRCSLTLCPLFLHHIKKVYIYSENMGKTLETKHAELHSKTALRNFEDANKVA